jgi:hypothetical protein
MTYSDNRAHYKPLFEELEIHTVFGLYILLFLLHVKDHIRENITREMIHSHNTRQRSRLDVPQVHPRASIQGLTRASAGYQVQAIRMFNRLPDDIKVLDRTSFKKRFSAFLIKRSYYCVQDFFQMGLT